MTQFTEFQMKKISSFMFTLSQISIGSVLFKFFEPGIKTEINIKILIPVSFGVIMAIGCFWAGMFFAARVKSV